MGRLTLIETVKEKDSKGRMRTYARCLCQCGKEHVCRMDGYKSGLVESCGCLQKERASFFGKSQIKHGCSKRRERHPLYNVWNHMLRRCRGYDCPRNKHQEAVNRNYRDRGIIVCNEWQSFKPFYEWSLANGWEQGLTLDRIDNNGIYSPQNCRYVDRYVQNNNSRKNCLVGAFGEKKTIAEWSRDARCQVDYNVLYERITKLAWEAEYAIALPQMKYKEIARHLQGDR